MLAVVKRRSEAPPGPESHTSATRLAAAVPRLRTADHIVDALERAGVDTVYGVPGGAISPIYDALVSRGAMRVVHVRHESSALFMAIGHARMRPGSLPCVLVTSGPGVTNAMTGLAAARAEGTPLILLAGEVPRSRFGRNALQEGSPASIDTVHMARTVTRFSGGITVPQHAAYQVAAAARLARAERGPVFLSLPLDVALAPGAASSFVPRAVAHPSLDPGAIERAATALASASQPLLLCGSGARHAAAEVRELSSRLGIPVITSPKAKGIVSEASPLCLGVFGYGGHPSALEWLERHPPDVVLALGCGLSEPSTNSWSPLLQASATMIQVDLDPTAFGRNYRVDVAIEGSVGDVLAALDRRLVPAPSRPLPVSGVTRISLPPPHFDEERPLAPGRVLAALGEHFPRDTVYTADIGEHLLFAIHYLHLTGPDQFIASLGLGSMGSGISAAVGAKLAAPQRTVVSICGDYGFQMFGMELATAVQEHLDLVFVIMNDARMRMVEAGVQRIYGRGLAMDGPRVDFAALARAHGATGFSVRSMADLKAAIEDRSTSGPTVLDVSIDPSASFPANARVQEISNFTASEGGR